MGERKDEERWEARRMRGEGARGMRGRCGRWRLGEGNVKWMIKASEENQVKGKHFTYGGGGGKGWK